MINELLLLVNILLVSGAAILALWLGEQALITFVSLTMVLANLFVVKQTTFFGLNATTADALAVGSMLGLNLLQEFMGQRSAKLSIGITFFALIFYAISAQIQLWYIPSSMDSSHANFESVLSYAPGLVIGSFVIYLLAQIMDLIIYGILNRAWNKRFMILRNYIAIGLSQLADTIMFSLWLLFLGIITNPISIIAVSFAIKFLVTLIATPIISFAATRIKEHRG
jgi:uncharacterized integral membrane protein (TIGR00697 family)